MNELTHEQRLQRERAEIAANDNGPALTGDANIDAFVLNTQHRAALAEYTHAALVYMFQAPDKLEALFIELAKKEADLLFLKDRPLKYDFAMVHKVSKEVLELREKIYAIYLHLETYKDLLERVRDGQ